MLIGYCVGSLLHITPPLTRLPSPPPRPCMLAARLMQTHERFNGFAKGVVLDNTSLVAAPLVQWTRAPLVPPVAVPGDAPAAEALPGLPGMPTPVMDLLAFNQSFNPLVQRYLTVAEQTRPGGGGPALLSAAAVEGIVGQARARGPIAHMQQPETAGFGIVVDARTAMDGHRQRAAYVNGALHPRDPAGGAVRELLTGHDGTPLLPSSTPIGVEAALMPFLFPFGTGWF